MTKNGAWGGISKTEPRNKEEERRVGKSSWSYKERRKVLKIVSSNFCNKGRRGEMKGEMMYREVVVLDKIWGWVIYGGGSLRQRDGVG